MVVVVIEPYLLFFRYVEKFICRLKVNRSGPYTWYPLSGVGLKGVRDKRYVWVLVRPFSPLPFKGTRESRSNVTFSHLMDPFY